MMEAALCRRGGVMETKTVKMDLMKKDVVCDTHCCIVAGDISSKYFA